MQTPKAVEMAWQQLIVEIASDQAEALCDALIESEALSASIEDALAGTDDEQPIFGEPGEPVAELWQHSRVTALFDTGTDVPLLLADAINQIGIRNLPPYQIQSLAEQDWVRLTQSQFDPIRISQRLWITPTWHEQPDPSAINLQLDPGLAFGTGSHPTTKLCLEWLDEHIKGGEHILDYGCGSGILAIAAMKLGTASATGTDIDPQAIRTSQDNAQKNRIQAYFCLPNILPEKKYNIVIANILANPLRMLGELLASRTCSGGTIVLSGILSEQAKELLDIYAQWFDMDEPVFDSGWTRLSGTRLASL